MFQQPKEQVASIEENWSTETSDLPKQFSFINIVEHAKKKWKECSKLC